MPGDATVSASSSSWADPQTGQVSGARNPLAPKPALTLRKPAKPLGPAKTVTSRCSMWNSTRRLFFNSPRFVPAEPVSRTVMIAARSTLRNCQQSVLILADASSLTARGKSPAMCAQDFSIFVKAGKVLKARCITSLASGRTGVASACVRLTSHRPRHVGL